MRRILFGLGVLAFGCVPFAAAQETPKVEIFGGYTYVRSNVIPSCLCFDLHGGSGSVAYNLNNWFGLVGDFGGYKASNVEGTGLDLTIFSYQFGPRISWRKNNRLTLFGHVLVGGARGSGSLLAPALGGSSQSENVFALTSGGGMDINLNRRLAVRVFQAEHFFTKFTNTTNNRQNNLRLSAGIVIHLGSR